MYGIEFEVSEEVMGEDFVVPIGKAKIMRKGKFKLFQIIFDF